MGRALVLALVLGLAACGGGDCAPRAGNYSVKFTTRDGTCGRMPEQITPVDDSTPPAQLGCSGTRTKSANNCEVTATSLSCGGGPSLTGTLRWNGDSSKASGTLSLVAAGCQGTYDVTYTKL
jgi:hypothetical protein